MHSSFWPACSAGERSASLGVLAPHVVHLPAAQCALLPRASRLFSPPAPCTTENGLNPQRNSSQYSSSQPLHTLQQLDAHEHPYVRSASGQPHYYRAARRASLRTRCPRPSRRARRARQRAVGARLVACRVAWGRPRLAGVPSAPPAASHGWSRASRPATPAASPTASRRTRARCRS